MPINWKSHAVAATDVVSAVRSGTNVFLHGACATPALLIEALCARRDLADVRLYHLHTAGPAPFAARGREQEFRSVSLFTGAPLREAIAESRADFVPIFLSDIPGLFLNRDVDLNVAILQVSPPDAHGLCSLGTSCDAAKAAAETARIVVAEINEQMPRTHGNNVLPFERIHAFIATDRPLVEHRPEPETAVEARIGELVAELVEDGSTLQMGIGGIPDAVLARLHHKRDLGIHTEMFSDRVVELVESGAVTNRMKAVGVGRIVTSFVNGTRRLFDFVHDNPLVAFYPCDWTNDTSVIRKNPKVVAINSALQIDLSGQVCADSIGHKIFSGIGGQMDFIRGAALSRGGKPIIALPSTASGGTISRLVVQLNAGAGVVTTRGHVHWVVTEYGAVNLHGKSLRERSEALVSIAHPDFRGELSRELRLAGIFHRNRRPLEGTSETGRSMTPSSPTISAAQSRALVAQLRRSQIFRDYERAFRDTTGLPITLRPIEAFDLPHHGDPKESPFCALMAQSNHSCAACLQLQRKVEEAARLEAKTLKCFAGLCDSAVPVRVGNNLIAFLQTGQILQHAPRQLEFSRATRELLELGVQVDLKRLEEAYFQTRVVTKKQYESILRLLVIFAQHLSTLSNQLMVQAAATEPPAIASARMFIAERYTEEISLTTVAQSVNMSAFYFCKSFKRATGMTFTDYLARVRVEKVKNILLNPHKRVSEAAYEAGFQSLSQFNRVFRRIAGESPTVYRDSLHGETA